MTVNAEPAHDTNRRRRRTFDAPEFLRDCLSQLQEENVAILYKTDARNRVTGFDVTVPGRGVVATVSIKHV